ncbi:hypothetical protein ACO1O0_005216 [Amphichorda felina]
MDEPTYTVFVRVPIPRGDFVDPPPVNWDSSKDDALWKILSGATQTEIDWNEIADRFNVPVDFLLKQVDYLTERHASQVRAQVRKATAAAKGGSHAPSPVPGSDSAAGIRSLRRESPAIRNDGSGTGTPLNTSTRPVVSRNTSTSTAVLRDVGGGSSSPRLGSSGRPGSGARIAEQSGRRRLSSIPMSSTPNQMPPAEPPREPSTSPGPAESSSTTSSDDESLPAQSRIIRRPPRFQQQQDTTNSYTDDEDDESEPAFQPYKPPAAEVKAPAQDLNSTMRGDGRSSASKRGPKGSTRDPHPNHSQTSDSDASSAALVQHPGKSRDQRAPGPLSPRRTVELSGKSPIGKGSREGSDGTPSMGSSFSDLDDASVTQSALEEALASHMNRGAASSRFSISQAFRSRYNPGGNQ